MNYVLNEAFYGRNKDLIYLEKKIIPKIRKVSLEDKPIIKYCTKEISEMERIFSKLFGIDKVHLTIGFHILQLDACTIKMQFNDNKGLYNLKATKDDYSMIKTPNGIRYKNTNKEMWIYISPYVFELEDSKMTLGIILHEIGHNFFMINEQYKYGMTQYIINNILITLSQIAFSTNPIELQKAFNDLLLNFVEGICYLFPPLRKIYFNIVLLITGRIDFINDKIDLVPAIRLINKIGQALIEMFGIVSIPLIIPLSVINMGKQAIAMTIGKYLISLFKSILPKIFGVVLTGTTYKDEIFADSFAASYGYGSGLVGTFGDFNNLLPNVIFSNNSSFNQISKTGLVLTLNLLSITDEHPQNLSRCENIIKKYEYELNNNKNLTKQQRKELINELEKSKDLIKTFESKDLSYRIQKLTKPIDSVKNKISTVTTKIDDKDIYNFESTFSKQGLLNENFDLNDLFI